MQQLESAEAQALAERIERLDARVSRLEDYTDQLARYTREEHGFVTHLGDTVDRGIALAVVWRRLWPGSPVRPVSLAR